MFKVSAKTTTLGALFCAATALLAAPASANFVGVSLCNQGNGSVHTPVLHIVDGGQRYTIAPGQAGLTTDIIMNERAATRWAAASGLFPDATMFGNYQGYICGMLRGDDRSEPAGQSPVASEPPVIDDDECETCGAVFD